MHCMDHKQLHDLGTADSSIYGISRSGRQLHFKMSWMDLHFGLRLAELSITSCCIRQINPNWCMLKSVACEQHLCELLESICSDLHVGKRVPSHYLRA